MNLDKKIKELEELSKENPFNAMILFKDLAMQSEIIQNYNLISQIRENITDVAAVYLDVSGKQIESMDNKRFSESMILSTFLNKYFFNEYNQRGISFSKKWDEKRSIQDFASVESWMNEVYLEQESNPSLKDCLYIMDKIKRVPIQRLKIGVNKIRELRNCEIKAKNFIFHHYLINMANVS